MSARGFDFAAALSKVSANKRRRKAGFSASLRQIFLSELAENGEVVIDSAWYQTRTKQAADRALEQTGRAVKSVTTNQMKQALVPVLEELADHIDVDSADDGLHVTVLNADKVAEVAELYS